MGNREYTSIQLSDMNVIVVNENINEQLPHDLKDGDYPVKIKSVDDIKGIFTIEYYNKIFVTYYNVIKARYKEI